MNALLLPLAAVSNAAPSPLGGPDIKDIVPPQQYYIRAIGLWPVAAVMCLLLAALVFWWLRRRPRSPAAPVYSPRELAARRLDDLETHLDDLDARTFGGAVADVLRVYIAAQYRLHPERQTSAEFLASITGSRAFSPVEHTLLTEFLESCDLLKFARADATRERKRRLLAQARNFIENSVEPPPALPLSQSLTLGA